MTNNISFPSLGLEFDIDPIALHYSSGGGVHWYGIIIAIGIVLAVLYCSRVAKRDGENPDTIFDIVLFSLPVAIIFARAYYVIFSWDSYKDSLSDVFKIWEGGLAIYGGIIGAVLTCAIYCKVKNLSILKIFDICSMGLLIGQSIGRWGNFVNAEAFGGKCDNFLRMSINGNAPVHPTFFYESMWNALGFIIISRLHRKKPFHGFTFFLYLVWYGVGRFFIEGMRQDSLYLGSFRVSQIVAIFCVITGILFLTVKFIKNRKNIG